MQSLTETLLALRFLCEVGEVPPETTDAIMEAVLPVFERLAHLREDTRNRSRNYRKRLRVVPSRDVTSPSRDGKNIIDFNTRVTSPSRDGPPPLNPPPLPLGDTPNGVSPRGRVDPQTGDLLPGHRGSRLAADWGPSKEDATFAMELGLDTKKVADEFKDYWHAKAGAGASKRDWHATWRNWCRRNAERTGDRGYGNRGTPTRNLARELLKQASLSISKQEVRTEFSNPGGGNVRGDGSTNSRGGDEPTLWDTDDQQISPKFE